MSFYQVLSRFYDDIFPKNPVQIEFLNRFTFNRNKILDIAAGSGNQALELAMAGHQVTAIDLDEVMIKTIKQKASARKLQLDAYALDMKNIETLDKSFDMIMCIGNSIVHLDSIDDISLTLKKIYHLLSKNGALIVQTVNYDRILQHNITELPVIHHAEKGITFVRTYEHAQKKIKFHGTLTIDNSFEQQTFQNCVELYPLTSNELMNAMGIAGFSTVELFGNFKGDSYHNDSPALIAVGYK